MFRTSILVALVGCGGAGSLQDIQENPDDTEVPANPEPEPEPEPPGDPALVVDELGIAGLLEDAHAFSLVVPVVNPLIDQQIQAGEPLVGLELRNVDDPAFVDDDDVSVGLYLLVDDDGDPADNFDPDQPETFSVPAAALVDGEPALDFTDGTLDDGRLDATGLNALELVDLGVPLPLSGLAIQGDLTVDDQGVRSLDDGRLTGAVGASLLALSPNLLSDNCPGESLLDVVATGCGIFGIQPDRDIDEDGLERLFDDDEDGQIDRCVDGDGTDILGTDCPFDPAIADGYELIFVIGAVRAQLTFPTPNP